MVTLESNHRPDEGMHLVADEARRRWIRNLRPLSSHEHEFFRARLRWLRWNNEHLTTEELVEFMRDQIVTGAYLRDIIRLQYPGQPATTYQSLPLHMRQHLQRCRDIREDGT